MWNHDSLTRDRIHIPYIARRILNHWTSREAPTQPVFGMEYPSLLFLSIDIENVYPNYGILSQRQSVFPSAAAAVTKSLQSCPTLFDPINSSPPGSPVPGILKARTLKWVPIFFSNSPLLACQIALK